VLAAVLFGALQHGGRFMEYQAGVLSELVRAINGLIVVTLSAPELWRLIRRKAAR